MDSYAQKTSKFSKLYKFTGNVLPFCLFAIQFTVRQHKNQLLGEHLSSSGNTCTMGDKGGKKDKNKSQKQKKSKQDQKDKKKADKKPKRTL